MVDGRFTLRNRTLTAEPDLRALCRAAAEASVRILHRAGIPAKRRVPTDSHATQKGRAATDVDTRSAVEVCADRLR
jgi:hypothetical protein